MKPVRKNTRSAPDVKSVYDLSREAIPSFSYPEVEGVILDTPGADPEGGFGDLSPLNILQVKIIKNVLREKRLALKFSQEIRAETRNF